MNHPADNGAHASFFLPDSGEVTPVTRGQMEEIDRIAVEETGPELLRMMENAGRSLAELILRRLGEGGPEARAPRFGSAFLVPLRRGVQGVPGREC